jgi:C1A family cysteine protease
MRTLKIFSLALLFSFLLLFVPRMGLVEDAPDQGTEEKCCSWTAGKTSVSDLSPEQKKNLHGLKLPEGYWEWRETLEKLEVPKGVTYPTRFDWRDSGGVTPARDQGQCGSCWDFCVLSALEAHVKIYGEVEMDLSEQQVLSCSTYGWGCDGAPPEIAYQYIINHGSVKEECMPYQADDEIPCADETCEKWAKMSHWSSVCNSPNVEAIKSAIYNYGPVSTLLAAPDTFSYYRGGCFDYTYFGLNHCVLLVGWDDTLCDGEPAWIGKNSWGDDWGMDGFFYIKQGVCQIGFGTDLPHYVFHRPYVRLEDWGINDEAGGNGNGTPESGETVRLDFTLKNLWSPLGEVEVTVSADTEGIVFTDDYSNLGNMDSKDIMDNSLDPMEFYVPDDFPVRRCYFTFHVSGDSGGGVIYTADTTVELWVGKVEILLVDDDQGVDISSNYEDYYLDALDSLKAVYHVWDKKEEPDTFYNFSDYKILIWFTGNHRDSIFSDTDIESLMTFLDNGGRLFLTSQDAVEVLSLGDALRQQFLEDYLHVGYAGNNEKPLVEGYPGDEVGDTLWIKPWGAGDNQISKDNLVPDSEADTVLVYANINWTSTGLIAGTKFRNDYFKVVLFGFGFEALSGGVHMGHPLSEPHFVMRRVLDWLNAPGPTIEVISPNGGDIWFVDSTCSIHWQSSSSFQDSVKIELFTDAGRESLIIIDTTTNDGEYCLVLDTFTPSDSCLIRISDVDNSIPWDISDNFFFILNYVPGDASDDDVVNIADVVYLVTYLFQKGPPPNPMASGDVTGPDDCVVNVADVVYLVTYLFGGGPPPQPGCAE